MPSFSLLVGAQVKPGSLPGLLGETLRFCSCSTEKLNIVKNVDFFQTANYCTS